MKHDKPVYINRTYIEEYPDNPERDLYDTTGSTGLQEGSMSRSRSRSRSRSNSRSRSSSDIDEVRAEEYVLALLCLYCRVSDIK